MTLAEEDISFIKQHLQEWLAEQRVSKSPVVYEIDLRERIVRIEEELKHQRTLIQQILHQMDKRFEQMEKRFEAAEKSREQRREEMLKLFEQLDKRFEQVDRHFEQVEKRFGQIDKRFEQIDKRFDEIVRRLDRFIFWSLGLTITAAFFVVKYLSP